MAQWPEWLVAVGESWVAGLARGRAYEDRTDDEWAAAVAGRWDVLAGAAEIDKAEAPGAWFGALRRGYESVGGEPLDWDNLLARLRTCGAFPVGAYVGTVAGVQAVRTARNRCNVPWCPSCRRAWAARRAVWMVDALAGVTRVEMWTLTVPAMEDRRAVLVRGWARFRKRLAAEGVPWGVGVELVGTDHWHAHVVVPRGTADRWGRERMAAPGWGATWSASWSAFRTVWAEACVGPRRWHLSWEPPLGWPVVARVGVAGGETVWAQTWVSIGPRKRGRAGEMGKVARKAWENARQAVGYAVKYAVKPGGSGGPYELGQWWARVRRLRRVWLPQGRERHPWFPVPGYRGADVTGADADRVVRDAWARAHAVSDAAAAARTAWRAVVVPGARPAPRVEWFRARVGRCPRVPEVVRRVPGAWRIWEAGVVDSSARAVGRARKRRPYGCCVWGVEVP